MFRSRRSRTVVALTAVVLLAWLLRSWWLPLPARFLIRTDPPEKADLVVVLGGGWNGERILTAGELVRAEWAPKVLVSGASGIYDSFECDLAIDYAVRRGFPPAYFEHFHVRAHSTHEEALVFCPEFERREAGRVILVTTDFHTRRAGNIFRDACPQVTFLVAAAPDRYFRPDAWWRDREGAKTFLLEWLKTFAAWISL